MNHINNIYSFIVNSISIYYINLIIFLVVFIFLLLTIAITTLFERKVMASMQRRRGPNVAGLFGFLQPIADGLKLFLKEIIIPTNANIFLFFLAPVFTFFSSIIIWLVIPFGNNVVLINTPYSMLYLLAISSLSVYGIIFSGWASNSKYAFLGGLRSSAQMISYEVCIAFVWLSICLISHSLNIIEVIKVQDECTWFIFPLLPMWIIFFIIALAETNRAPFDLPEAEAELVAGYNVEYSSIAFALFFLGEYSNMIIMSSLRTLFFWGGWLPFFDLYIISPFFWFGLKVTFHLFMFVWVRATLPRYRYDQLMKLGWKVLMPISVSLLLYFSSCVFFCNLVIMNEFYDDNMVYDSMSGVGVDSGTIFFIRILTLNFFYNDTFIVNSLTYTELFVVLFLAKSLSLIIFLFNLIIIYSHGNIMIQDLRSLPGRINKQYINTKNFINKLKQAIDDAKLRRKILRKKRKDGIF